MATVMARATWGRKGRASPAAARNRAGGALRCAGLGEQTAWSSSLTRRNSSRPARCNPRPYVSEAGGQTRGHGMGRVQAVQRDY